MRQLLFSLFTIMLCACSTCTVAKRFSIQEIQFGNGGGFTGAVETYTLRKDGRIITQNKKDIKLSCDSLRAIFELAEQLPKENFVHPENIYSFIRVSTKNETYYYAWSWGDLPDKKVIELYLKLKKQL